MFQSHVADSLEVRCGGIAVHWQFGGEVRRAERLANLELLGEHVIVRVRSQDLHGIDRDARVVVRLPEVLVNVRRNAELELAKVVLRRLLFGSQRSAPTTPATSATCGTSVPIPRRLPRDSRTRFGRSGSATPTRSA